VGPDVVAETQHSNPPAVLIDVRERSEWEEGHLSGAVHIPRGFLEEWIEHLVPNRQTPVVLYCAGGVRSALAAAALGEMGYTNTVSMMGGFRLWKDLAFPFEVPRVMSSVERQRYSRHALLPEVGEAGQFKLLDASVLIVGAGGLGSPNLLYLAAAGVGTIGVVDSDVVDMSNLHRQVVHGTADIDSPKVESAARAVSDLNPDIDFRRHNERLTSENATQLLEPYDIIVDAGDTFDTRYVLNEAAVRLNKPLVTASILSYEGQITTVLPGSGPCYRCIFPKAPSSDLAPSCAEAGVLGVIPGVMGSLQATEVLKLILGLGDTLSGRLLMFDARAMSFYALKVKRDPECPICGSLSA
jgi:adenylyltransferase/sulfurtransferase